MPLNEYESKEALRVATDWLVQFDPPGAAAAREGIADVIPLVMMGAVTPNDLDDLASIVEERGAQLNDPAVPPEAQRSQLHDAVTAAFDHVRSQAGR
jgi:hypothetical protein